MSTCDHTSTKLCVPEELSGEAHRKFDDDLQRILSSGAKEVSLDTSQLKWVTSSHISLLWDVYSECRECGARAILVSPTPELIKVLQVLDLYDILIAKELDPASCVQLTKAVQFPQGSSGEVYADEFRANVLSIEQAMGGFMRFLRSLDLSEILEFELRSVFYEVTTNIRIHGQTEEQAPIVFSACANSEKINLVFADSGQGFDPTSAEVEFDLEKASRSGQKRGFGINLIRKLTDHIEYKRRDGKTNVLSLEKNWSR